MSRCVGHGPYNVRMKIVVLAASLVLSAQLVAQTRETCALSNAPVSVTRCEPFMIYVADFGRDRIERILNKYFDGFTVLSAHGCWKGSCEDSFVIEIAGAKEAKVRAAAEELRVSGKQQSVIVVAPAVAHMPR